jgi:uncharacterized protein YifN (PemK superfamily)
VAIHFPVGPGTILLCDYSTGFRPPEMVKRRPAVVVSPRLPRRDNLCSVVPLSLTSPAYDVPYQVKVVLDDELPGWPGLERWAKADMLATVGFHRLDLFRTSRDPSGRRKYLQMKLNPDQFKAVRIAMLHALGLGALTPHL